MKKLIHLFVLAAIGATLAGCATDDSQVASFTPTQNAVNDQNTYSIAAFQDANSERYKKDYPNAAVVVRSAIENAFVKYGKHVVRGKGDIEISGVVTAYYRGSFGGLYTTVGINIKAIDSQSGDILSMASMVKSTKWNYKYDPSKWSQEVADELVKSIIEKTRRSGRAPRGQKRLANEVGALPQQTKQTTETIPQQNPVNTAQRESDVSALPPTPTPRSTNNAVPTAANAATTNNEAKTVDKANQTVSTLATSKPATNPAVPKESTKTSSGKPSFTLHEIQPGFPSIFGTQLPGVMMKSGEVKMTTTPEGFVCVEMRSVDRVSHKENNASCEFGMPYSTLVETLYTNEKGGYADVAPKDKRTFYRIYGKWKISYGLFKCTIYGDEKEPLEFSLEKGIGLKYIEGKGVVTVTGGSLTVPPGTSITLPPAK